GFAEHSAETVLQNERRRIEQILSQFALRCADAQTACREIEAEGAPVEQILHEAQRTDLVILGSETFFEYGSETADATAEDVLRHSPRPVVCVPKELPDCKNCIVVAYDGSLQAARALHAFWA